MVAATISSVFKLEICPELFNLFLIVVYKLEMLAPAMYAIIMTAVVIIPYKI